jgi:hypothetical protein
MATSSWAEGARFRDNDVVCIVATARTVVLLLSVALAGCATGPSPQCLDARAGCRQQWETTGNLPSTAEAYINQCMAARGYLPNGTGSGLPPTVVGVRL